MLVATNLVKITNLIGEIWHTSDAPPNDIPPMPATITEIRYQNLRLLRTSAKTVASFAEQAGLSLAQASQLTTAGKNSGGKFKLLGDTLARRIEEHMGLERGWLDREQEDSDVPVLPEPVASKAAPKESAAPANLSEKALNLDGLSPLQVALLTTAEQLCRTKALTDKQCLALLAGWQDLLT